MYDIETSYIRANIWRLGKQAVRHNQLDPTRNKYDIISIAWTDNQARDPQALHWGYKGESSQQMVATFDEVIKDYQDKGYVIVGKNNKSFDNKHINTLRWLYGHNPMADWGKYTADLEKMIRRTFNLPSYSLDYFSEIRGWGGKHKMEFSDWTDIVTMKEAYRAIEHSSYGKPAVTELAPVLWGDNITNIINKGKTALDKMVEYNIKDVVDTLNGLEDVLPYVEWKNSLVGQPHIITEEVNLEELTCVKCGGSNIHKNGIRGEFQRFFCNDCGSTAGRAKILKSGKYGKVL